MSVNAREEKIFTVELSRWNPSGINPSVEITLPATPYELEDALEKARITGDTVYSAEVLSCKLDYLPQFIAPDANLHELNHLAQRLSSLSAWELDCFEGMVMMDAVQTQYAPISAERLINMTHSMVAPPNGWQGVLSAMICWMTVRLSAFPAICWRKRVSP